MGKRKHKDSQERIKEKIRKLEKRLRRYEHSDSSDESFAGRDPNPAYSRYEEESPIMELTDSDASNMQTDIRSTVHIVDDYNEAPPTACSSPKSRVAEDATEALPSTSQQNLTAPTVNTVVDCPTTSIPTDILDILGNSKKKQEIFGPKIQEEISKRWGRILCEGLNKVQKKELIENILVPENFQLVKAPNLNPEIAAVVTESARNRDKRLEKTQNYLGLGISTLTSLISSLIEKDAINIDKMDIIKHLSETNQILLDLHFESTFNRRKLITYTLDKKFLDIVENVQRDSLLFGENLTDKIKATKAAEKSGLQYRKSNNMSDSSTSKKFPSQQGNWRGPSRQSQRGNRRGGTRSRSAYRPTRRSAPVTDYYQDSSKTRSRLQSRPQ